MTRDEAVALIEAALPVMWDDLEFRCGRCSVRFTSTSADQHEVRVNLHGAVHDLADVGHRAGMGYGESLDWATEAARAIVRGRPRVAAELLPAVTVTA